MNRAMPACALAVLCAAVAVTPAQSQVPGYQQLDPRSVRAEYTAEVLARINDVVTDWGDAWSFDEIDDLLDQYWEDAILIPPGHTPLQGHAQMRPYFEQVMPRHGQVEAFMLDFDASGGMALIYGNYMIGIQDGPGRGTQQTGPLITVYVQRGRTWKIRNQTFLPPITP